MSQVAAMLLFPPSLPPSAFAPASVCVLLLRCSLHRAAPQALQQQFIYMSPVVAARD